MRRFKFRLENVLRHRETVETLREQDFAAAQGTLLAIEQRIAQLREEFRQTVAGRPGGECGEHFDAHAIIGRERYLETLQAAIGQMERRVEAARIAAEDARLALVAARQAREAVSNLREKDFARHTAENLKLEQATLDEQAGLRHSRAIRADDAEQKEKAA